MLSAMREANPQPGPDVRSLDRGRTALFLDCDGTLAAIVERPEQALVRPEMLELVCELAGLCGCALAVVSGRSVAQLDTMLAPLHLPLAGVHGAERRDAAGAVHRLPASPSIDEVAARAAGFAALHDGVLYESKPGSVAVHYRLRPALQSAVEAFAAEVSAAHPELRVLRGKMVVEISGSRRTKGDAIRDFMGEAPFAGRVPVFVGDDVTDEDGFAAAAALGGIGIRIGAGPTSARYRLSDIAAFADWLGGLRDRWRLAD